MIRELASNLLSKNKAWEISDHSSINHFPPRRSECNNAITQQMNEAQTIKAKTPDKGELNKELARCALIVRCRDGAEQ